MRELVLPSLVFVSLVVASLGAMVIVHRLPAHHHSDDTHTVIKQAATVFVLMASVLLGLLVNTSNNTFDSADRDVHAFATELILLDRALRTYGPETGETRKHLLAYAERALETRWPKTGSPLIEDPLAQQLLDSVESSLRAIQVPPDRADLMRIAASRMQKVVELRWTLIGAAEGTIYTPLFFMLLAWLILVFGSVGFNAPNNPVVVLTLVVSAFVIALSIYLVLEMDRPFEGPVRVSATAMKQAIAEMRR